MQIVMSVSRNEYRNKSQCMASHIPLQGIPTATNLFVWHPTDRHPIDHPKGFKCKSLCLAYYKPLQWVHNVNLVHMTNCHNVSRSKSLCCHPKSTTSSTDTNLRFCHQTNRHKESKPYSLTHHRLPQGFQTQTFVPGTSQNATKRSKVNVYD